MKVVEKRPGVKKIRKSDKALFFVEQSGLNSNGMIRLVVLVKMYRWLFFDL